MKSLRYLLPCVLVLPFVTADKCTDARQAMIDQNTVACLKSIPFHPDEALNVLTEVRKYLSFYSAGTYFEHLPCPELDLPNVDINGTLDTIESKIKRKEYTSDYDVNKDFLNLFGSVKDGHVRFSPTCVGGAFQFEHAYPLIQVAPTADSLPETYVATVDTGSTNPSAPKIGKKVTKINGQDPNQYLENMAKNDPESSWIDPDARFNELLAHVESGEWTKGLFASRSVYPEEQIEITFEDGNKVQIQWTAIFNNKLPDAATTPIPFTDSDSFYKTMCIRTDKEVAAVTSDDLFNPQQPSPGPGNKTKRDNGTVRMAKLKERNSIAKRAFWPSSISWGSIDQGKEIGGYQLDDKTAVIFVRAFDSISGNENGFVAAFSYAVGEIIAACKKNGIERLLIDVTGNGGGIVALGQNFAHQLFPTSQKIFFGTNMRWNPTLDIMLTKGDTSKIDQTYFKLGHLHKPNGSDWKDFPEMLGPVHRDDDYFTKISIPDEKQANTDTGGELYMDFPTDAYFKTENVVLVSSGLCGSTCAVFGEVLQAQGVKIVSFGGRPRKGPMQGIGGIKGSQVLSFDEIAGYAYGFLKSAITGDSTAFGISIPKAIKTRTYTGMSRINFRNSWRRDDGQYLPIEFLYTPTEWRLFYTKEMTQSIRKVHEAASQIAWGKGLQDMTGGPYTPVNGLDGHGFKWPQGSGETGGFGESSSDSSGTPFTAHWKTLGELIWKTMRNGDTGGEL
ncbi:hypothetical protein K440DRAFT_663082 [Wilcoxina mikolae CBS 423.85]|nr:hypothetical protein K440DRAFT_663082 [Wilcoxina mikolae CBS 423.85]